MLAPTRPPIQQTILVFKILTLAMAFTMVPFGIVLFILQKWVINPAVFNQLMFAQPTQALMILAALLYVTRIPIANLVFKKAVVGLRIEDTDQWLAAYFVPHLIKIAFAEAAGMMGFVIAYLYDESTSFVVLGLAAVIGILREMPSLEKIKEQFLLVQSSQTRGRT